MEVNVQVQLKNDVHSKDQIEIYTSYLYFLFHCKKIVKIYVIVLFLKNLKSCIIFWQKNILYTDD